MKYTVDLQKIADELEFDLEDIEMLMEVFLESAKENLDNLKSAMDKDDFEAIFQASHAIKGSAANIMLDDVTAVAQEIENRAREKQTFDYTDSYEKLKFSIEDLARG